MDPTSSTLEGCSVCARFPVPTSAYAEIAVSPVRHGTLYRCRKCSAYIEVIESDRTPRFISPEVAKSLYPQAF